MSEMGKLLSGNKMRRKKSKAGLPSSKAKLTAEKAKKILRHGTVRGRKLTKKQRGMFGAIAGRGGS